jgi:hypothetical protein
MAYEYTQQGLTVGAKPTNSNQIKASWTKVQCIDWALDCAPSMRLERLAELLASERISGDDAKLALAGKCEARASHVKTGGFTPREMWRRGKAMARTSALLADGHDNGGLVPTERAALGDLRRGWGFNPPREEGEYEGSSYWGPAEMALAIVTGIARRLRWSRTVEVARGAWVWNPRAKRSEKTGRTYGATVFREHPAGDDRKIVVRWKGANDNATKDELRRIWRSLKPDGETAFKAALTYWAPEFIEAGIWEEPSPLVKNSGNKPSEAQWEAAAGIARRWFFELTNVNPESWSEGTRAAWEDAHVTKG